MSARLSTNRPRACSGAMYAAVPRIMPIAVIAGEAKGRRIRRVPAAGCRLRTSGQAKVQHLHDAIGPDLDVGRLQVAVDDAGVVRGFERQGDLMRDGQRLVGRDRALRDAVGKRGPFDQFEHERHLAVLLLETVDGRDVRVVERGQDLGFALEPREARRIGRHRRRQDLDRHVAFQLAVARAIDLAHSAFADLRGDFVGAEAGAGRESQGVA